MATLLPVPSADRRPAPRTAMLVMGAGLALLWLLELADQVTAHSLDRFGIATREIGSLPAIYAAPFLHADWNHLIANSLPFAVLGSLVLLGGVARWLWSSLISITASGLTAWLISPPHTITLGASGLIFGWLTYLLARGIFSRNLTQILIAVAVFAVYGSVLWGIFPTTQLVSWQGHLGGAIGGVLAAYWLDRRSATRPVV